MDVNADVAVLTSADADTEADIGNNILVDVDEVASQYYYWTTSNAN